MDYRINQKPSYLVSLTYDYFFKKVFFHEDIAKKFFEDVLSITIESIEHIDITHKLTNEAMEVRFDYKCKVDGEYFILEMQRHYPKDSIKRFYTYNCVGNVVQLENILAEKKVEQERLRLATGKTKTIRHEYQFILPTKTIVWMADETLGYKEDMIQFTMQPKHYIDFIKDEALWVAGNLEEIQKRRKFLLEISQNNTKDISFLAKNQLIFMFQRNIVKNRVAKPYYDWFDFSHKTRNLNNKATDFEAFEDNEIFKKIIRLLKRDEMKQFDLNIVEEMEREVTMRDIMIEQYLEDLEEKNQILVEQNEALKQKDNILEEKDQVLEQQNLVIQKLIQEKKASILKMLKINLTVEVIAEFLVSPIEEIQQYIEEMKQKGNEDKD